MKKLHTERNLNQNTKLFIHKNASENIVCETVAILSKATRVEMIFTELSYITTDADRDLTSVSPWSYTSVQRPSIGLKYGINYINNPVTYAAHMNYLLYKGGIQASLTNKE